MKKQIRIIVRIVVHILTLLKCMTYDNKNEKVRKKMVTEVDDRTDLEKEQDARLLEEIKKEHKKRYKAFKDTLKGVNTNKVSSVIDELAYTERALLALDLAYYAKGIHEQFEDLKIKYEKKCLECDELSFKAV